MFKPVTPDAAVGREIRQHRRLAGLTLKEVADKIGVTGAQLHRYETGATRITASRLIAIASVLGVRADTLLATASESKPQPALDMVSDNHEIAELLRTFIDIADPRQRNALVTLARMMAPSHHLQKAAEAMTPAGA